MDRPRILAYITGTVGQELASTRTSDTKGALSGKLFDGVRLFCESARKAPPTCGAASVGTPRPTSHLST